MPHIESFGARGGEVTGSMHVITGDNGTQVLVDLGMIQGPGEQATEANYRPLPFDVSRLGSVVLTHAHLDHVGRLPLLVREGYEGKIYMTEPTKRLLPLILHDAVQVNNLERNSHAKEKMPLLYEDGDVEAVLKLTETVDYGQKIDIGDFETIFSPAGHILGSASIAMTEKGGQTVVFSGDLGNTKRGILAPAQPAPGGEIAVMESTYGDKNHPDDDPADVIQEEVNRIEKRKRGTLMIPAFSLHRTQDLLHILRTLKKTGKIKLKTQVFVDSPMGIGATQIYSDCHAVNSVHFSDALRQSTADPFKFPQRVMTQESWRYKTVASQRGPQVVIAGAGMMNGGRILRHAINYLPDENSSILFVGYQGEGTLGRRIAEGEKRVAIDDQPVHVRAQVNRLHGMSSHADQDRLLEWLKESGAQTVYLVHGGDEQRQALKAKIDRKIKVITP